MTLRTLNYGNYGIFLIVGNAGFCPSTVCRNPMNEALFLQGPFIFELSVYSLQYRWFTTAFGHKYIYIHRERERENKHMHIYICMYVCIYIYILGTTRGYEYQLSADDLGLKIPNRDQKLFEGNPKPHTRNRRDCPVLQRSWVPEGSLNEDAHTSWPKPYSRTLKHVK